MPDEATEVEGAGPAGDLSEPLLPPPPSDEAVEDNEGDDAPPPSYELAVSSSAAPSAPGEGGGGGGSPLPLPLLLSASTLSLSQFLLGYNTGVMNAPHAVVFPSHSTLAWSIAVSAFCVGGAVGAAVGGGLANAVGRRNATLIDAATFLLGGTVQALAPNMGWIVLSRCIIGVGSGMASTVGPMYLGELSPPSLKGAMGTVTQLMIVLGILASTLLAFPLATEQMWRWLFGATAIVAAAQLLLSPLLVESPRWLLAKDPESAEAREALRKLRGLEGAGGEEEAERAAEELIREVSEDEDYEAVVTADTANGEDAGEQNGEVGGGTEGGGTRRRKVGSVRAMLSDPTVRLPVVTALILPMSQQLSGINAVFYYSTMFFEGVVSNPLVGTAAVAFVNVLATVLALALMDRYGRKTLIFTSACGMFVCSVALVLTLLGVFSESVALLAVNLYVASFELGLGPIPFLVVPELFGHEYVGAAMSLSLLVNWACNFLVGLVFPHMHEALGPYSFVPFAIVLLGTAAFAWGWMPETGTGAVATAEAEGEQTEENGGGGGGRGGLTERLLGGWRRKEDVEAEAEAEECDGSII